MEFIRLETICSDWKIILNVDLKKIQKQYNKKKSFFVFLLFLFSFFLLGKGNDPTLFCTKQSAGKVLGSFIYFFSFEAPVLSVNKDTNVKYPSWDQNSLTNEGRGLFKMKKGYKDRSLKANSEDNTLGFVSVFSYRFGILNIGYWKNWPRQ